jgi:regulatory protein
MPTVTRIAEQRRAANRRSIHLDGAFAFGCNLNVVARFRLREGLTLSPEQVADIQQGEVRQECLGAAFRSLQSRLHSRAELKRKLMRKEWGEPVVDGVLDDLHRMGYLDDARFAAARVASSATVKRHGRRRAKLELLRHGVARDVADAALSTAYTPASSLAAATDLAERQAARLRKLEPLVARRRLVGMLQRRGFDYDEIRRVVDRVLGSTADE